jgi:hypothetical protein
VVLCVEMSVSPRRDEFASYIQMLTFISGITSLTALAGQWGIPDLKPRGEDVVIAEEIVMGSFTDTQIMPKVVANDTSSIASTDVLGKRQNCGTGFGYCASKSSHPSFGRIYS